MNGPAGRVFLIAGVHRTNAARTSRTICFRSLAVTYSGTMTRRRFDSSEKRKKRKRKDRCDLPAIWRLDLRHHRDPSCALHFVSLVQAGKMDRLARRRVQIADRNTLDTIYEEKEKIYSINRNRMSYTMRTIDDWIDYVLDEVYIYIYIT